MSFRSSYNNFIIYATTKNENFWYFFTKHMLNTEYYGEIF